ncbi:alpha/beta hydrolase family protein [Lysinibacillus piscis]|uniref:Peptidase YtmA n=1 Tax=Lysinibacillus piscis TaxID=2518931 RepID=A0ABQ5NIP0_9BACI|nr:prolyl oligopeptidase family serine peptidase [Lysinibacillus sp. KH24]GLC88154.1 putative peptidase YtmA [Lysinibacillus sp. KH24]
MRNGEIVATRPYPSPNAKVRLTEVTYYSQGLRVKGLLAEPKEAGNYDGFLYLRGGMQNIGMVRPSRIAQFAMQGFVVFAPYYRGNRGGEGRDEFAGQDRYDAVYAVDVLKHYCSNAIHVFGFSRGGLMALWTAILRSDITSVVVWAGVSDATATYWERIDMRRMLKRVVGGSPNRVPEAYHKRTPLFDITAIEAPVLIIHGTQDENVDMGHARQLEQHLQKTYKVYETWYYERLTHFFPTMINLQVVHKLCRWMKAQKRGGH